MASVQQTGSFGNLGIEKALESLHQTASEIFRNSLDDCRIDSAFDRHIRFESSRLIRPLDAGGEHSTIDLNDFKRVFVISIGKAAVPMLQTLLSRMDRRKGLRGICCSNQNSSQNSGHPTGLQNWRIRYFEGGHPLPNEDSFAAARATLALLRGAHKDTLVIFLISGGASAIFELPSDPNISLEDSMVFHQALIASGAPITEINVIRKHFSAVKGGRLAIAADNSLKLSVLLPDVPLRSLDTLASGPTYPDHTTAEEALGLIHKYDLWPKFPSSVSAFFKNLQTESASESGGAADHSTPLISRIPMPRIPWRDGISRTPKRTLPATADPNDPSFRSSLSEVLLSSNDLVEMARNRAEEAGFYTVVDNGCDDWDYADAARYLLERFHALRKEHPRCCLISGGEVTVTLNRNPGAGGRNQQFALACAIELAQYSGEPLIAFSAGSDGIDGNTRAAGAIADTTTVTRAATFGYQPTEALAAFNACPLFTALGDSVSTGPTGHNLRDLRLLMSTPIE